MYKLKLAVLSLAIIGMTLFVGGSLATMQDRSNTNNQTNQNNSNRNRNANGNTNRNANDNTNRNTNGNTNGNMNPDSMMNSNMMNSNSMSDSGMIGNISMEEFMRINAEGGAKVAAITPTSAPLSRDDQKMMLEVAMGGMMQLEVSRAALGKVTSPEARTLAQAEVEEQTALGEKLKEIAAAKNVTLPTEPDSKTRSMIAKMQERSAGMDFDRYYVRESGVKGHEKLDKTMSKVQSRAADETLKTLAATALPLVRTHLQVSRAVVEQMTGNRNGSRNNSMNMNSNSNSNR